LLFFIASVRVFLLTLTLIPVDPIYKLQYHLVRTSAKASEYRSEGVPSPAQRAIKDTVRGTVVCDDHASLVAAHAAVLASPLFVGTITKDRREEPSCRDVLQVVLFDGLLCEVQFHFKDTLPLKAFSHAAYNIKRPQDNDLVAFDTVFDYPTIGMENKSRGKDPVTCKLHF
jgi:hypothetical protein